MKKIMISACLMGENVRFDGKNKKKTQQSLSNGKKKAD